MQKDIDQLKQELVQEIKALSAEIAKSNTYIGVISNEMKFRVLQEKFINLKFLEHKHIGLDIFDQPIPKEYNDEKEEMWNMEDEEAVEVISENEINVEEDDVQLGKEIQDIDHKIEETKEKPVISHSFTDSDYAFDDLISKKQFPSIKLDFNDKIAFLNQLFNGNKDQMDFVVDAFNQMSSLQDSKLYLSDLKKEMDWENKEEYVERLETLIIKRFE